MGWTYSYYELYLHETIYLCQCYNNIAMSCWVILYIIKLRWRSFLWLTLDWVLMWFVIVILVFAFMLYLLQSLKMMNTFYWVEMDYSGGEYLQTMTEIFTTITERLASLDIMWSQIWDSPQTPPYNIAVIFGRFQVQV